MAAVEALTGFQRTGAAGQVAEGPDGRTGGYPVMFLNNRGDLFGHNGERWRRIEQRVDVGFYRFRQPSVFVDA